MNYIPNYRFTIIPSVLVYLLTKLFGSELKLNPFILTFQKDVGGESIGYRADTLSINYIR